MLEIDEMRETVDIKGWRPVWRGGGITYGNCCEGWETPRAGPFRELKETEAVRDILVKMKGAEIGFGDNEADD